MLAVAIEQKRSVMRAETTSRGYHRSKTLTDNETTSSRSCDKNDDIDI